MSEKCRISPSASEYAVPFGSNSVRLSGGEWVVAGLFCVGLLLFLPSLWLRVERFAPDADYRLPSKLSDDYWLYSRYCRLACFRGKTLVIGDSATRGYYVSKHNTLSHYLNEAAGRDTFANMGVDGMHPVALFGLLKYYGRDISGKKVIVHLNPLWFSSAKFDLQTDKEFHFHHPKLVPQFVPNIPCYKDSYSTRIAAIVERSMNFSGWVSHVKKTYFDNMDLAAWTVEHPYRNPLRAITLELPTDEDYNQADHVSWIEKGIAKEDFEWVELAKSLQWRFFQRSMDLLRARGNRVFVLVGPFNEHILETGSAATYGKMKSQIESWLQRSNLPYFMAPPLPSELYRDASHPLSEGYSMLARQLFDTESCRTFLR